MSTDGAQETLYQSDTLHVTYRGGRASPRVVVTFDQMTDPEGPRSNWGEDFLAVNGFDNIHIAVYTNAWYQYEDMPAALAAITAVTEKYQGVVTYGLSMGAYAAINFSQALKAELVIAIAPQYSIDPRKIPFDKAFDHVTQGLTFVCDQIDKITKPAAKTYVIYDPKHSDRHHVDLIMKTIPVTPIHVPFGGHGPLFLLIDVGFFSELIHDLLNDCFDPCALNELLARKSPDSGFYHFNLALSLPRRQRTRALEAAWRAVHLQPSNPWFFLPVLMLLLQSGSTQEATAAIEEHLPQWPDPARRAYYEYVLLYIRGAYQEALDRLLEDRRKWPASHSLSLAASLVFERLGRHAEAVETARNVVRLRPRDRIFRLYVIWLRLPRTLRNLSVAQGLIYRRLLPLAAY